MNPTKVLKLDNHYTKNVKNNLWTYAKLFKLINCYLLYVSTPPLNSVLLSIQIKVFEYYSKLFYTFIT